jgi:amino acid adenylation domain-containing protein
VLTCPIAPDYPEERIALMMKDSRARVLLSHTPTHVSPQEVEIVDLNLQYLPVEESWETENPCTPMDPVYLVYTSGTTGVPKGIVIENRSMVNFLEAMAAVIYIRWADRLLSLTSLSFDIFGLEIFLPLTRGAAVVIGSFQHQMNPGDAAKVMRKENIALFQVTPSRLQLLLAEPDFCSALKGLRYLLVGGEVFPRGLPDKVSRYTRAQIYNLYGPAETTIWSTIKKLTTGESITIGKPIANTRIYILNQNLQPQPVNIAGELYIGGHGLARGYLNRPELTAEKFKRAVISHSLLVISSPDKVSTNDRSPKPTPNDQCPMTNDRSKKFSPNDRSPKLSPNDQWPMTNDRSKKFSTNDRSSKLYRTGDLARWLPDGEIEFLGRIDQ